MIVTRPTAKLSQMVRQSLRWAFPYSPSTLTFFLFNFCSLNSFQASPLLTQQNGTKSPQKGATATNGDANKDPSQPQVSNQTVPGPQSASHVVIDEKKKKGRACCVIQQKVLVDQSIISFLLLSIASVTSMSTISTWQFLCSNRNLKLKNN